MQHIFLLLFFFFFGNSINSIFVYCNQFKKKKNEKTKQIHFYDKIEYYNTTAEEILTKHKKKKKQVKTEEKKMGKKSLFNLLIQDHHRIVLNGQAITC